MYYSSYRKNRVAVKTHGCSGAYFKLQPNGHAIPGDGPINISSEFPRPNWKNPSSGQTDTPQSLSVGGGGLNLRKDALWAFVRGPPSTGFRYSFDFNQSLNQNNTQKIQYVRVKKSTWPKKNRTPREFCPLMKMTHQLRTFAEQKARRKKKNDKNCIDFRHCLHLNLLLMIIVFTNYNLIYYL